MKYKTVENLNVAVSPGTGLYSRLASVCVNACGICVVSIRVCERACVVRACTSMWPVSGECVACSRAQSPGLWASSLHVVDWPQRDTVKHFDPKQTGDLVRLGREARTAWDWNGLRGSGSFLQRRSPRPRRPCRPKKSPTGWDDSRARTPFFLASKQLSSSHRKGTRTCSNRTRNRNDFLSGPPSDTCSRAHFLSWKASSQPPSPASQSLHCSFTFCHIQETWGPRESSKLVNMWELPIYLFCLRKKFDFFSTYIQVSDGNMESILRDLRIMQNTASILLHMHRLLTQVCIMCFSVIKWWRQTYGSALLLPS